jgi:acetyltransferase-like isoleucine patch superfamily enzyme
MFINDRHPSVAQAQRGEWKMEEIYVKDQASIGTGALIMGGVTIGKGATIGAGAVVTRDVRDKETVVGIPARRLRK